MEKYKPGYLGKVLPVNNPSKLADFVTNKYEAFSNAYDACKNQSEKIDDVKLVESVEDTNSISIKVSTDKETLATIKETSINNESVIINNDIITAKP